MRRFSIGFIARLFVAATIIMFVVWQLQQFHILATTAELAIVLKDLFLLMLAVSAILVFGRYAALEPRARNGSAKPKKIDRRILLAGICSFVVGAVLLLIWLRMSEDTGVSNLVEVVSGILFYGGFALIGLALLKIDPLKILPSRKEKNEKTDRET